MASIADRIETIVTWATGIIASVFLIYLMIGTSADVASRFLLGPSIPGVFELAELSLVVCVLFGLGWTQQSRRHIRVTLLVDRLPKRARIWLEAIAWLGTGLLLILMAVPATQEAYHSTLDREFRWGVVRMPVWWVRIIVALGLWLAAAQMIKCAVDAVLRPESEKQMSNDKDQGIPHA